MTLKLTPNKGLSLASLLKTQPKAPNPANVARAIPNASPEHKPILESIVHQTDAKLAAEDAFLATHMAKPNPAPNSEEVQLSRLLEDDFPFDPSQLEAVYGIVQQQFACLTGAAGTGKTTVTKKIVDLLKDGLGSVDLATYWKPAQEGVDEEDEEAAVPEHRVPSIAIAAFTGRAAQMVKKNFPVDWHSNIMTIHRMLGFVPEFFEEFDVETGSIRKTMRFVPTYTKDLKLPWDIIVIDEAGMVGLDLWHMVWAAAKRGCRVILIGDINQLPPTHGKSIFGFAMSEWPSWELTHVHRQKGANNSIVDNAHRVLKGLKPASDSPTPLSMKNQKSTLEALTFMLKNKDWRFLTVDVDEGSVKAGAYIRESLRVLKNSTFYDPNRDAVITAINGYDTAATGFALGQDTMNRELSVMLNPDSPRYIIDAGRERRVFAVGDKVMATKNDWAAGITNGMTGIVTGITEHGTYAGDRRAFGRQDLVDQFLADSDDDEPFELTLEDFSSHSFGGSEEKEKAGRGPASHMITIEFGEGRSAITMTFSTQAEVGSIQLAYVVTCHKMQGGEAPLVFVVVHQSHKRMLNREWLYTAITRAAGRCVLLVTRDGVGAALGKQSIKGKTLADKVAAFQALQKVGIAGAAVKVNMPRRSDMMKVEVTHKVEVTTTIRMERVNEPAPAKRVVDGGDITPTRVALPQQVKLFPQVGAAKVEMHLRDLRSQRLLPRPIPPAPPQKKVVAKPFSLADLIRKKNNA